MIEGNLFSGQSCTKSHASVTCQKIDDNKFSIVWSICGVIFVAVDVLELVIIDEFSSLGFTLWVVSTSREPLQQLLNLWKHSRVSSVLAHCRHGERLSTSSYIVYWTQLIGRSVYWTQLIGHSVYWSS